MTNATYKIAPAVAGTYAAKNPWFALRRDSLLCLLRTNAQFVNLPTSSPLATMPKKWRKMMFTAAQKFVSYALSIGALELIPDGRKLRSRRISPYFFNSGLFNTGEALKELSVAYAKTIDWNFKQRSYTLFGPAYKGTILAPAVAIELNSMDFKTSFTTNRKEVKDHGEGGDLIGASLSGANVVIIDDVITTGETKMEAIEFVKSHGGAVASVIVAFDRQETVGDTGRSASQIFQEKTGVPVYAAANLDDLIAVLKMDVDFAGCGPDTLSSILKYKEQYGVK